MARTRDELTRDVAEIMAMTIRGKRVVGVLLEEAVDIERELYLALAVDRAAKRPLLLFSVRGGVDIEAVARDEPQALLRAAHRSPRGLTDAQIAELVGWAGLPGGLAAQFAALLRDLWRLFCAHDATLVEINPLVRHPRRPAHGARRQGHPRRQRRLPPPRMGGLRRPTPTSASGAPPRPASTTCRSTATSACWATGPAW